MYASLFPAACEPVSNMSSERDGTEHVSWQVTAKFDFHTRLEVKSISRNTNKKAYSRNMTGNKEKCG